MTGSCSECRHYRAMTWASDRFARAGLRNSPETVNVIAEIGRQEERIFEGECLRKISGGGKNHDEWPSKPSILAYCAVHEHGNSQDPKPVFYIHEIKNAGRRCRNFRQGPSPHQSCENCMHRVEPYGLAEDRKILGALSPSLYGAPPVLTQGQFLQQTREKEASEIRAAFGSNIGLGEEPRYLSYCHKLSQSGRFKLCVMLNPHNTCPHWQASSSTSTTKTGSWWGWLGVGILAAAATALLSTSKAKEGGEASASADNSKAPEK